MQQAVCALILIRYQNNLANRDFDILVFTVVQDWPFLRSHYSCSLQTMQGKQWNHMTTVFLQHAHILAVPRDIATAHRNGQRAASSELHGSWQAGDTQQHPQLFHYSERNSAHSNFCSHILHQTWQKSIKRFRNYWGECKAKHCNVWATISVAPEAKIKQNKKTYSEVTVPLGNAQTIYLLCLWVGNDTGTVKILLWLKQAQGQDLKSGLNCIWSFFIYQLKQMEENCNLAPVSSQLYITQTERAEGFWYYYKFYVLLTF